MPRSILLVDPDVRQRARMQCELDGYGVQVVGEAATPDEAMRLAAITGPDVAVLADGLGMGDGILLADRLATEHGIPSVLIASGIEAVAIASTARSGIMGLLANPMDHAILHAMLELAVFRFQELLTLRREAESLRKTLESRKIIERGKGLLMETEGISEQEAFARIRQKSMDTQRSMAEIARAIILAAEVSGRTR